MTLGRVRGLARAAVCTGGSQPSGHGTAGPGLTFRAARAPGAVGAVGTYGGRAGPRCVDPWVGGGAGQWRWAEPGGKSTHGCGWLPPVAQYQGVAGEDILFLFFFLP